MRQIKFRAWINKNNMGKPQMFYQGEQYLQSFLRRCVFFSNDEGRDHEKYGDYLLMQFTGLSDKNGKEIYEGDILRMKCKSPKREGEEMNNYIDFFSGGTHCGYRFRGIKTRYSAPLTKNRLINGEMEIIGNIHENIDLL